jgi:WD40 repeat protein
LAVAGGTPAEDGTVEIFAWPEGQSIRVLDGHFDSVMAVCWLDESTIASGGLDHQVLIWNAVNGQVVRRLKGHSRGLTSLAFLDGKGILVSTGIDQSLRVWETGTGELLQSMAIHVRPVSSVSPRPPGEGLPMIASASDDRTVRFWQPTIGRMVRFARLPSPPRDVKWSPEGLNAIACCEDGHVYLIDPETVEVIGDVQALSGWAYTIAVHPTDGTIVVAGSDGVIQRIAFPSTR